MIFYNSLRQSDRTGALRKRRSYLSGTSDDNFDYDGCRCQETAGNVMSRYGAAGGNAVQKGKPCGLCI
jgi:hypothetical protein